MIRLPARKKDCPDCGRPQMAWGSAGLMIFCVFSAALIGALSGVYLAPKLFQAEAVKTFFMVGLFMVLGVGAIFIWYAKTCASDGREWCGCSDDL